MIIFTILISMTILIGSLAAYASYSYIEHKGYIRGMEEAEQIVKEVRDETYNI